MKRIIIALLMMFSFESHGQITDIQYIGTTVKDLIIIADYAKYEYEKNEKDKYIIFKNDLNHWLTFYYNDKKVITNVQHTPKRCEQLAIDLIYLHQNYTLASKEPVVYKKDKRYIRVINEDGVISFYETLNFNIK